MNILNITINILQYSFGSNESQQKNNALEKK